MNVSYKRGLNGNCMILEDLDAEHADKFALQMILTNKIPGLLDVHLETFNNRSRLSYDISARQSLDKMFETGKMKRKQFKNLVSSLKDLNARLGDYLLDSEYIMALPEYIFTDIDREKFYFCYNPFYEGSLQKDLGTLADSIISYIDYDDAQLVKSAYEMNALMQRENFSIHELVSILDEINDEEEIRVKGLFADKKDASGKISPASNDDIDISEFIRQDDKPPRQTKMHNTAGFDFIRREKEKSIPDKPVSTRRNKNAPNESFINKLKIYLKGRKLKEVIEDIDNGVILDSIDMCYKRYKKENHSFDLPVKVKSSAQEAPRNVNNTAVSERNVNSIPVSGRNVSNTSATAREPARGEVSFSARIKPLSTGHSGQNNCSLANQEKIIHMNMDIDEDEQFCSGMDFLKGTENGTVLLKESPQSRRKLVGTGSQQGNVTEVNRYPFLIGKIAREADLILPEPSVSRMHARIYKKTDQNQWELEDLNSTNGTFVNGTKLDAYTKQIIKPGDLISIADQEFIFR